MKFSVIIPAYNCAAFLPGSVATLRAQDFTEWEAIIVDDGSTDSTLSVAQRLAAEDPRIRVLTQPNGGVSRARNRGLDAAEGDWIVWLDADDAYVDGALATIARLTEEHPDCAALQFPYIAWDSAAETKKPLVPRPYSEFGGRAYTGVEAFDILFARRGLAGQHYQPWRFVFRRDAKPRFRAGTIHEDIDVLPLHMARLEHVYIAREPLYVYRLAHAAASTAAFTPRRVRDILDVTDHVTDDIAASNLPRALKSGFRAMVAYNLFGYFLASAGFAEPDRTELLNEFARRKAALVAIAWPPKTAWLKRLLLRVLGVKLTGRLVGALTSYRGFHKLSPKQ